jgi:hypothetical protein
MGRLAKQYECIHLHPENGGSQDQLRRNHFTQSLFAHGAPWRTLREKTPEKYESHVDLRPRHWTRIRIQVAGSNARLYVTETQQQTLIVNDLASPVQPWALMLCAPISWRTSPV